MAECIGEFYRTETVLGNSKGEIPENVYLTRGYEKKAFHIGEYSLRAEQKLILQTIMHSTIISDKSMIVSLACGFGKGLMTMAIAIAWTNWDPEVTAWIVCPTPFLASYAFIKYGDHDKELVTLHGDETAAKSNKIVIMTAE